MAKGGLWFALVFLGTSCLVFAAGGNIPVYTAGTFSAAGHYYMTAEITGNIIIDADNVTFDLNGHSLTGSVTVGSAAFRNNVAVKNGRVISGNVTFPNGGKDITVDDIVIQGPGGNISVQYLSTQSENLVIENCRATAILLARAHGARLAYNQLESPSNGNGAIFLDQCNGVDVLHNIVRNSSAYGIHLSLSYNCTINHNTVQGVSNGGGITLENSSGCTISHNQSNRNGPGILIQNPNGANQILYNNCSHNLFQGGIVLYGDSLVGTVSGHDVSFNTCSYNTGYGIGLVGGYGKFNRVSNNVCSANQEWAGILVGGAEGNSIDWNTCSGNIYGIYISASSLGNVYSHNRCMANISGNYSDLGINTSVLYSAGNPTNY